MNLKDILVRMISFSCHRRFHFVSFICEQKYAWKMKPFFFMFQILCDLYDMINCRCSMQDESNIGNDCPNSSRLLMQ